MADPTPPSLSDVQKSLTGKTSAPTAKPKNDAGDAGKGKAVSGATPVSAPKTAAKPLVKPGVKPVKKGTDKKVETPEKKPAKTGKRPLYFWKFLHDDGVFESSVPNEEAETKRRQKLMTLIRYQNYVIAGLILFLVMGVPFFQPVYEHYTLSPDGEKQPLLALDMPNLTNEAVLSWSTTAITEVLTVGFGDFDQQMISQRERFTEKGWDNFVDALQKDNMRNAFKERQLVLTSVPSDTPVITGQGADEKGVYVWQVEMPVIMTYTTNNNVTRKSKSVVSLTISRVPVEENERGIAIKTWRIAGGG